MSLKFVQQGGLFHRVERDEMKVTIRFIASLAFATIVILVLVYGYMQFIYFGQSWKQKTTPLPSETIAQLCTGLHLEKDDSLCNGRKDVYGPDFYDVIRDTFRPYEEYQTVSSEAATYDDVKRKIGIFEYECDDVATTGDEFSFFVCRYDLRGDRVFRIGIMYTYPDNAVFRIMTPMGFDGE